MCSIPVETVTSLRQVTPRSTLDEGTARARWWRPLAIRSTWRPWSSPSSTALPAQIASRSRPLGRVSISCVARYSENTAAPTSPSILSHSGGLVIKASGFITGVSDRTAPTQHYIVDVIHPGIGCSSSNEHYWIAESIGVSNGVTEAPR